MKIKLRHIALFGLIATTTLSVSAKEIAKPLSHPIKESRTAVEQNAWLEISQNAFEENLQSLFIMLDNKSTLCAIMKADAYGFGLDLLLPVAIQKGVQCIGVASNKELQATRKLGFNGRLMRVRSATLQEMEQVLPQQVEELIGNLEVAEKLSRLAQKHQTTVKVHLGLNSTGMSRNGIELSTERGFDKAKRITTLPGLKIVGLMSHYPVEEIEDVKIGLARFNEQTAKLIAETQLDREQLKLHIANSFAAVELPESRLDMVRIGGSLYGDAFTSQEFQRIMSFKSKIAAVNAYPKGNSIGYDKTHTLTRDSLLANIPVGYSDGYRRVFSNRGFVLIQGEKAPVLGKTSMNTIMVDVTDIKNVHLGDEVVLFGRQGNSEVSVADIEAVNEGSFADMYTLWGAANDKILVP